MLSNILQVVSSHTGISIEQIKGKSRKTPVVNARFIFCLCAKKRKFFLREISKEINRDHTTVINAINQLNDWMDVEDKLKEQVVKIEKEINLSTCLQEITL